MTKKDGYDEISVFCLFSSISACQNLFVSPYRPLHAKMPLQVFDISLGERSVPHSTLTLASSRAPSLLLVFNLGKSDAVKLDDDFSKADMQSDSCLTLLFHQKHFYCCDEKQFPTPGRILRSNTQRWLSPSPRPAGSCTIIIYYYDDHHYKSLL